MKKLFFVLISLILLSLNAKADIAPAEQISYSFKFEGVQPLKIMPGNSEQLQCEDNQCLSPKPLGRFGIQKLECREAACHAVSYEFSPYQKLIIKFEDGSVRESEVFKTPSGRKNAMQITVTPFDLSVSSANSKTAPDTLPKSYILFSLLFVFLTETAAAAIFVFMNKLPAGVILSFSVLNVITIPLNWFVLSNYFQSDGILWLTAFLIEFALLCLLFRKKSIYTELFGLTLFANVAGYSSGMILSFIMTFF